MASYLFLGVWLICGIVCFAIKHSLFDVYYTEGGFLRELGQIAAISLFMALFVIAVVVKHPFLSAAGIVAIIAIVCAVRRSRS